MAKERIHELKQTENSFQLIGVITGTEKNRFYKNGDTKNGGKWNSLEFGVKINDGKTIYCTLKGFPRSEVFYYKKGEKGAKGTTQKVSWNNRHKSPGAGYRLIGVNISTSKDDQGKNVNESFTEYDAVEFLHGHLHDGDNVFIRGSLEFSSYTDRNGQLKRKVELVPNQISYTTSPVNFAANDFVEMAEFENTIVFSSIDKEEDENGKATGRFILSGYSVGYNNVETVNFIIDADHAKVASAIKKKMKSGNSIKTYGRISVQNNVEAAPAEDDGWGSTETSPMERVTAPTIREYVVYKVDGSTFDTETYSEKAIAEALKKIKAAREAAANFGEKPESNAGASDDDWGADDDDDMGNDPW